MEILEKLIIRWALKRLRPRLDWLRGATYEGLAQWGIGDLMVEPNTFDIAIFIDPEL